jgi:hypothetical protein
VFAGCAQAPEPLQTSLVHGLPSSVHAVPDAAKQLSVASVQVRAHIAPLAQGSPACVQAPAAQTSAPLQ